jgi:hypothetical protein
LFCFFQIAAERVLLGYHSIGQVMTGGAIGIFLHFYSTRVPQLMIFLDVVIVTIGGFIAIAFDQVDLDYKPWDGLSFCSSIFAQPFTSPLLFRSKYCSMVHPGSFFLLLVCLFSILTD